MNPFCDYTRNSLCFLPTTHVRQVTEQDVRALLNAGMREHLQLEYKSVSYEQNDNGRREFLQTFACLRMLREECF